MYHDHGYSRSSRDETPFRVTLMRGLTVLTFAFIVLNVSNWSKQDATKPELSALAVNAAGQMLDDIATKAKAARTAYTLEKAARDYDRLIALSQALEPFRGGLVTADEGPSNILALQRKLNYVRSEISSLGMFHSGIDATGTMADGYHMHQAVNDYRKKHGTAAPPDYIPAVPKQPINWRNVARRGVDGWLLAMLPAFLTILISFRLRRESLWAELVERPWGPVLSTICWPVGLWGYVGQPGIIERRLQSLIQNYRETHHADPDQTWIAAQRLVLMRRARDVQHGLAQITEYPELIRINSRRAILISWLVAMLSGPFQMFLGVVQAYAQVAKTAGGIDSSQVDSSRVQRRRFSGFTDGNIETASDGQRLTTSGHLRGKLKIGEDGLFVHVNARTLQPLEAFATTQVGATQFMAGMVVPYAVFDYPAPWNALFRSSPGFNLLPLFSDFGLQAETRAGPLTLRAGLLTGDGANGKTDDHHDLGLRLSGTYRTLSGSASYQGGDQHDYLAGNVMFANAHGSITYEVARRNDDNPKLEGSMHQLEVIGQRGSWRMGVQLASAKQQTLLGVIELSFGGFKRVMLERLAVDGSAPVWTLRLQQGLKLATP